MNSRSTLLVASLSWLCATAAFADINTNLVSYWPLENNSGTTADLAGGNSLTLFGSPGTVTGQVGNGMSFNGTSQYASLIHGTNGSATGLPIYGSGAYTISLWVKGAAQTAKYIFTEGNTVNASPLLLIQTGNAAASNSKLDIFLRSTSGTALINHVASTNTVFDNNWHHIALADDHGAVKLYVDGNLDAATINYSYTNGALAVNTTAIGALVRSTVSGFFNGSMDDVAIWERALSQSEIQTIKNSSVPQPITATAPVFVQQPSSATNAMGDRVYFTSGTTGTRPIAFQWLIDGNPLPGQTNFQLVLTSLTQPTTNNYSVIASNAVGAVTSSAATLVVLPDSSTNAGTNLVSFWPFDAVTVAANTNTPDTYSLNNMQLNAMDASSLVTGQFSNALAFDGIKQFVNRVGGFPIYNNTNYTVALWVKGLPGQTNRFVFSEGATNSAFPVMAIGTDLTGLTARASVTIRNNANTALMAGLQSTRSVFDGNWHHLVWVDENGRGKLYVDSVLDETDFTYNRTGTFVLHSTAAGALVYTNTVTNFFAGSEDDLAVWNRRLSYTEITQIYSNGVPPLVAAVAPTISAQPVSQTNAIFAGDNISFSVQAVGTGPLSYRWNKNGANISLSNPSATNTTLSLTGVQASDSGSYTVVVTNSAGAITSSVALLLVAPYTAVTNGDVLDIDFDLTGTPNTQPGFSMMNLALSGTNFNGVKVTIASLGNGPLAERDRLAPAALNNNPPLLTQGQLYSDFLFVNSATDGTGVSISIERLSPNIQYGLTLWSWDSQSTGARPSDWIETATGTPVVIKTGYTFTGSIPPTNDGDDTIGALLTSSASGKLQIEGRKNGGTSVAVFVNAIRLVAQPTISISGLQVVGGNVQFTVTTQYPGQSIQIQQNDTLAPGNWVTATGGTIAAHGTTVFASFPASANYLFYRVISP